MSTLRTGGSYVADPDSGERKLVERTLPPEMGEAAEKGGRSSARRQPPKPTSAPLAPGAPSDTKPQE